MLNFNASQVIAEIMTACNRKVFYKHLKCGVCSKFSIQMIARLTHQVEEQELTLHAAKKKFSESVKLLCQDTGEPCQVKSRYLRSLQKTNTSLD